VTSAESVFFWISLVLYALASGGYVYSLVFKNAAFMERLVHVIACGFAMQTAAIVARYTATGHLPWSGDYEQGLMGGWFIILCTLYVGYGRRKLHVIAVGTVPVVLIIMGYGVMRHPVLTPMEASLKTVWLYIHVYFAWLAYGAYALAFGAGVVYLLKTRDDARSVHNPVFAKMPPLDRLEDLMFRYVVFGFIADAVMIAAGAIWAKDLWGSYWSWDPVETWSLVSWLIYGIAIHLRVTLGWRGRKLAWLVICALATVFMSFFGVNFVVDTSMHFFNVR
jgi:cytochrome c-type biogenesis protein CcsB